MERKLIKASGPTLTVTVVAQTVHRSDTAEWWWLRMTRTMLNTNAC